MKQGLDSASQDDNIQLNNYSHEKILSKHGRSNISV